jgi:histidyl-tRNA synthetase
VFGKLGVNSTIKINNRKILSGMAEVVGESERLIDITVAIDKIDKIGLDAVNKELSEKGVSAKAIDMLQPIITLSGSNTEKLQKLRNVLAASVTGMKGIDEMQQIFDSLQPLQGLKTKVELDLSLARGLNYYTGAIFEVKANDMEMGSICGGGRYDDLTGIFGLKNVSGVGVSFGADRIYDVMLHLGAFPESLLSSSRVMFANFGSREAAFCLPILQQLRSSGISAELYPDAAKMKKQFDYANKKNIAFVVIVGEAEMQAGIASVKDMVSGNQETIKIEELVEHLK